MTRLQQNAHGHHLGRNQQPSLVCQPRQAPGFLLAALRGSRRRAAPTGCSMTKRATGEKRRPDDTLSGRGVDRKRTLKDHGVSK
jgi:hypothetical protein